jgi:predicted AAA+ superfamily ATPase
MTAAPRLGRRITTRRDGARKLTFANMSTGCVPIAVAPSRAVVRGTFRRSSARAPAGRAVGRARRVAARGLGFDLGEAAEDKLRPEVEAQALIEDAASLLYLQESLRSPAAQAYLVLLQQIAMKATPTKLFTAYGSFFRAQIATDSPSFADHVLDQVISGRDNPLAAACASGRAPKPAELAAARADRAANQSSPQSSPEDVPAWNPAEEGSVVAAPASSEAVAALRERVLQSWSWSETLPALMAHWRDHGVGDVGAHCVLTWHPKRGLTARRADGAAEETPAPLGDAWTAEPLARQAETRDALVDVLRAHVAGETRDGANHVLVHGRPGVGKRWTMRSACGAVFGEGLRVVRVSRGDLRALPEMLDAVREHPRARFAMLLEMPLCLAPYAEFHNELTSALDGGGGGAWPSNAVLVAAALTPTALKPGAEDDGAGGTSLAVRFATTLALDGETEA